MPTRKTTTSTKAKKQEAHPRRKSSAKPTRVRTVSKQATVIAMLSGGKGATIPAVMKATGWQQHSVRGFFAGVVRRKLKLDLASEMVDGTRVYRIGKTTPKQESLKTAAKQG